MQEFRRGSIGVNNTNKMDGDDAKETCTPGSNRGFDRQYLWLRAGQRYAIRHSRRRVALHKQDV
ncbi:hypothetical protein PSAC2689_10073 [Paraburkholderia sacchari]